MKNKQSDSSFDEFSSFDSPLKNVRTLSCPDTTISDRQDSRTHYFQTQLTKFKQAQSQIIAVQMSKLQKGKTKLLFSSIAILIVLLMSLFALYSQLQKVSFRVSQLEYKQRQMHADMQEVQRILIEQNQLIEILSSSNEKLQEEIIDIHMNELLKEQRSMYILQKYTNSFKFQISKQIDYFEYHFHKAAHGRAVEVRKKSDEELMFYSSSAIPNNGIYYAKIKIEETLNGMIAFGLIPKHKRQQTCVYCDSKQIFYIYCKNGKIYNGQFLEIVKSSRNTRFSSIKNGDIVTMFVDNKQRKVIWYVNSRYAGSYQLPKEVSEWYAFVEMTSRGDIIRILE